tara:strand:+ start:5254 stop:5964 length:711 start_codon:yes stop_codon:yes gene_type:complete
MDFLELCQRTSRECGASGAMTTTVDQVGTFQNIVDWVGTAWEDLQTQHDDWWWMRSSNLNGAGMSFTTVSAQSAYPLGSGAGTVGVTAANFGKWVKDSFRCYTTTVGFSNELPLDQISYDVWRNAYMMGSMRSVTTRPVVIAEGPGKALFLGPPPNALYTITGDYFTAPSVMSDDTDEPTGLPDQYHMLIVYKAMESYGMFEAASEVVTRAQKESRKYLNRLEVLQLPTVHFAGAL